MNSIDHLVEDNSNQTWNKIEKTFKITKLYEYVDSCVEQQLLLPEHAENLKKQLKEKINRKQLQRSKDVCYDKERGKVTAVAALHFDSAKGYSFKNTDAVSPLLSLAPKNKTVRKNPLNEM